MTTYNPLPAQLAGHTVHISGPSGNTVPMFLTVRDLTTGEEIAHCVKAEIICDVDEGLSIVHLSLVDFTKPMPETIHEPFPTVTVDVPCTFALSAEVRSLSARPQRE